MLKTILFIGAGSFFGGVARYLVSRAVQSSVGSGFPWGTMVVNVAGCLLIGFLYGLFDRNHIGNEAVRMFLTVGFCGGFTTFSTFVHENYVLMCTGHFSHAVLYPLLSFAAGLLAAWIGHLVVRSV